MADAVSSSAEINDLELDSESNTGSAQAAAVRKNIPLKLKGKARGRGRRSTRARKVPAKKSASHPTSTSFEDDDDAEEPTESSNKKFDIGEDISKLETPTFTTLERGLPEPVHQNKKLRWDHRVHLIGEKVMNPMIHCCGKCALPILMYGRMIPCKHVFCFECARKAEKTCPKCKEVIHRVEPSKLGTVFMCTFGGPRHGTGGCRRTYLSQRDLQAHINHRHMRTAVTHANTATTHGQVSHPTQATSNISTTTTVQKTPHLASGRDPRDPRTHLVETVHPSHTPPQSTHPIPPNSSHTSHLHPHLPPEHREPAEPTRPTSGLGSPVASSRSSHPYQHTSTTTAHMHGSYPSTIPSVSTRPNLITVPIQDDSTTSNQHVHVQSHQSQYSPAAASQTHQLPPMQHQNANNAYSSHHYQPHPSPTSSYSPVPPVTYGTSLSTQSFNPAPPTHMPPPPMHNANAAMYPNPPPSVHHPQQSSYSAPPLGGVSHSLPPQPQRFSSSSSYDENYSSQGWSSGVPPPSRNPHSTRAMQGPQNSPNVGILQQCGQEPGFRGSYYQ